MEIIIIVTAFLIITWYLGAEHKPSRPSKETLNEACPNHNTGDFAVFIEDDIRIEEENSKNK